MGEIANDMATGHMCSHCGTYFLKAHGFPVLCRSCWRETSDADRKTEGVQRATHMELS